MAPPCEHLVLKSIKSNDGFGFKCNGCRQMGYGSYYGCENRCDDYHLHKECVEAPKIASHHFLENRPFTLQRKLFPSTINSCRACGMAVRGWRYCYVRQSGDRIFLHPGCMKMPICIKIDGHSLFLKQELTSLNCRVCKRTTLEGAIKGWAYVSSNQKLVCHVKCMKDKLYKDWKKYAHKELTGPLSLSSFPGLSSNSEITRQQRGAVPGQQVVHHHHYHDGHQASTQTRSHAARRQQHNSNSLVLYVVGSSSNSSSGPSGLVVPAQGQHNNSLALTRTKHTGIGRQMWKLFKVAFKLLFSW